MVTVQACSRLHFGLLNLGEPTEMARSFGGVGLMVQRPGLRVSVADASTWSADGPLAERALAFAHRFAQTVQTDGLAEAPPRHLIVEWAAPEHAGLGTGTQLGLAVARALAVSWGLDFGVSELAKRVGRGLRSALGVHGFEQGGFLVEAGKRSGDQLAPLVVRVPPPESWRVVLILPAGVPPLSPLSPRGRGVGGEGAVFLPSPLRGRGVGGEGGAAGLHGAGEVEVFTRLAAQPADPQRTAVLCRLVLLGLLPALVERDFDAFGEAVYEFNSRVGEAFAPVQGGTYACPRVAELVAFVRGQGVRGVGQSSWGPTVFVVVADEQRAEHLAGRLRERFALAADAVVVTAAANQGAACV